MANHKIYMKQPKEVILGKDVQFLISIDGVDELFNYIRYGDA